MRNILNCMLLHVKGRGSTSRKRSAQQSGDYEILTTMQYMAQVIVVGGVALLTRPTYLTYLQRLSQQLFATSDVRKYFPPGVRQTT